MGDLDVDIVLTLEELVVFALMVTLGRLTPLLGLEFTPLHVALDGLSVVAEPAFKLVIGTRHCCGWNWYMCNGSMNVSIGQKLQTLGTGAAPSRCLITAR